MIRRTINPSAGLTDQIYYRLSEGLKQMSEKPLPDFTGPEYQKEVSPGVFVPDEIKIQNALQKSSDDSRNDLARLIADNIILGSNEGCLPLSGGSLSGKLAALYGFSAGINGTEVLNVYVRGISTRGVQIKGELRLESDTLYINGHPVISYKDGILTLDAKKVVCTGEMPGGGGSSQTIYIIKDKDTTEAKDDNVYSALRIKNTLEGMNTALEQKYLRKDRDDSTSFLLDLMGGVNIGMENERYGTVFDLLGRMLTNSITSHDYNPGMLGTGYKLYNKAANGRSYLEVDELFVRAKAFFSELEIKKLSYAGGNWVFSPAGMTCSKVEETETYYRCYFVAENKDGAVTNDFRIDDLVKMKEYNVDNGTVRNTSNRYFWRRCIAVGKDYIDLSVTDCDQSVPNDAPKVGDSLVTFGNKTDQSRQNAVVISAYGDGSPSVVQYVGIKDYTTAGTEKTRISPTSGNLLTGEFVFESGENVREYTDNQIQSAVTTSNQKIDKVVNDLAGNISITNQLQKDIDDIKKQSDGAIDTWFYDDPPTLDNEPAKNWKTETDKEKHIADLYYDKDGLSYRFEKRDGQYQWKLITDSGLSDALSRLDKMEATVDKKMRVFVRQPKFEESYAEGDLWADAVYTDNSHDFSHDLLRCVTPKEINMPFDINHWKLATKYTDDTRANQAIEDAANAQLAADNAKQKAAEAQQRMSNWISDKVISPIEKKGLRDEIVRIDADKDEITRGHTAYGLGDPSAYLTAYTKYRGQLVLLSSPEPECRPVPDTFVTDQDEYYNQRTLALYAISSAAKEHIDNGLANMKEVYDGRFTATDKLIEGRLEKTVYAKDKDGIDKKIAAHESAISQTAEKIKLMVTKETYDAGIKGVADRVTKAEASINVQAGQITQQVDKVAVLEGTVAEHATALLELTPEKISAQVKKETQGLDGRITSAVALIQANTEGIALQAGRIDTLDGTVAEHSAWIETAPESISAKVKEDVNGELSLTGIDITSHKITLTADQTEIKNNDGGTIVLFSDDGNGGIRFDSSVYCTNVQATKGKIGAFEINGDGLENADHKAFLKIGQSGARYFYANVGNEYVCDIRGDGMAGLRVQTYTAGSVAIMAQAQAGGNTITYALKTIGSVEMLTRASESVVITGVCVNYRVIASFDYDKTIKSNDDFVIIQASSADMVIDMPRCHSGKRLYLKKIGNWKVTLRGKIRQCNNDSIMESMELSQATQMFIQEDLPSNTSVKPIWTHCFMG